MKIHWIHGSVQRCGRSQHLDGRIRAEDLDYFYPTDVLVTGYDIIFFWVIRMVFSGYAAYWKSAVPYRIYPWTGKRFTGT